MFQREAMSMAQRATPLREIKGGPAQGDRIIDAKFSEVRGERRTLWGKLKLAVIALFWAAAIGFLIPPAWMFVQRMSVAFGAG
jgi:hypothetical protein